jgi:hypothetical protein
MDADAHKCTIRAMDENIGRLRCALEPRGRSRMQGQAPCRLQQQQQQQQQQQWVDSRAHDDLLAEPAN